MKAVEEQKKVVTEIKIKTEVKKPEPKVSESKPSPQVQAANASKKALAQINPAAPTGLEPPPKDW